MFSPIRLRGGQGESLGNIVRNEWAEDGTTLLLESALANIRDEIAADFAVGQVRPFTEGEIIGSMQSRPKHEPLAMTPEEKWLHRIEECAILRARNDRAMARTLEG